MRTTAARALVALVLVSLTIPREARANDELLEAYQKELAFLEAEKQALKKRLSSVKGETKRKIGRANGASRSVFAGVLR